MKTTFHICKRNVDLVAKPWKPHAYAPQETNEAFFIPYKFLVGVGIGLYSFSIDLKRYAWK